uniref:Transmembrane protein 209 n=1 Tax=Globodera rostochiensis TaxID=31243 RepID=A0A914HBN2_GLORO
MGSSAIIHKLADSHLLRHSAFWFLAAFFMILELSIFNGYLLWRVSNKILPLSFIYVLELTLFCLALANAFFYLGTHLTSMYSNMKAKLFVGSIRSSTDMDTSVGSVDSAKMEHLNALCTFMGNFFKRPATLPNQQNSTSLLSSTFSEMDASSLSSLVGYHDSPLNKTVSSVHSRSQLNYILENETCDSVIDPTDCAAYFNYNPPGTSRFYQAGTPQYLLQDEDTAVTGIRSFIDEHKLSKYARRPDKRLFQRTRGDASPKLHIVTELKEILEIYGLREQDMEMYEIKLRIWLCNTIIRPLVDKIDDINVDFAEKHQSLHLKVGSSSLETILAHKDVLSTTFVPFVLPYLRAHNNQQYVVSRMRTLCRNIALEQFKWNGGGEQCARDENDSFDRLVHWSEQLPTDTELIWHLFCTYMDFHITPSSEGVSSEFNKPFTNVFFANLADGKLPLALMRGNILQSKQQQQQQTPVELAEKFFIRMSSSRPPAFELIVDGGETIVLPCKDGPHNFWYVLILFLAHIAKMSQSRIGPIHLSSLSLNIFDG